MRHTRMLVAVVGTLTLGLASLVAAQMMGGTADHSATGEADSTWHSGMMGQGMMTNMGAMMGNLSQNCTLMSKEFQDLENHFDKMMQIQDMGELKAEMQKHHEMMLAMHDGLSREQSMCQHITSMMQSGGMSGMMGANSTEPGTSGQHGHNH